MDRYQLSHIVWLVTPGTAVHEGSRLEEDISVRRTCVNTECVHSYRCSLRGSTNFGGQYYPKTVRSMMVQVNG